VLLLRRVDRPSDNDIRLSGAEMSRIERNRLYHCREESGRTGQFSISEEGMTLRLFDYDGFFRVESGTVLHARIEDSRTISLHDTIAGGTGNSSITGERAVTTYASTIHANTLVVGNQRWERDDPIRRAWFAIRKTKQLLLNSRKLRELASRSLTPRPGDNLLFEAHSRRLSLRCWYAWSGSFELGMNDWWPVFDIEFREPKTLQNYLEEIHRVLRFFSVAAGFQLTPSEICVSSFTSAETEWRQKSGQHISDHQVEYLWPEARVREYDLHPLNSFVCAFDRRETKTMAACLSAWLDRPSEWEDASALMMGSLGLHNEVSGDRLLMAYRWLEKIPGALSERALADEDVAGITDAAVQEATRRKLAGMEERIVGALRNLRYEANRERFIRLIRAVNRRFGDTGLDDASVRHLMLAQRLRGAAAHGVLDPHEGRSLELQRAFTSLESLCYLLMIKDLPLPPKSRGRAVSNRLVRDYQYAKIAR
jgi:hypothetical protein